MLNATIHTAKAARAYARAAFEYAKTHQQLSEWSNRLQVLADIIQQPLVQKLLKNPQYTAKTGGEIVLALGKNVLDVSGENFVKVLTLHKRLLLLPHIEQLFKQFRACLDKTSFVQVKSAVALDENCASKLLSALTQQLKTQVEINYEIDPYLLGGMVLYVGDKVLDASLRTQLNKLKFELTR